MADERQVDLRRRCRAGAGAGLPLNHSGVSPEWSNSGDISPRVQTALDRAAKVFFLIIQCRRG